MEVVDHGVHGGAITLTGKVHLTWTDERLNFENISREMHCDSFQVKGSSIWTPKLKGDEDAVTSEQGQLADLPEELVVSVQADGRIMDSFWGRTTLRCTSIEGGASKECVLKWQDTSGNRNLGYVPRGGSNGILVRDPESMPPSGYKLNQTASALTVTIDEEVGPEIQRVVLTLQFDPLESDCNICGDDKGTSLIPDVVPTSRQWLDRYPETKGWTCAQLDGYLSNLTVGYSGCNIGRAFFEEPCCDDSRSNFECESTIHDALADETNTITPPGKYFLFA